MAAAVRPNPADLRIPCPICRGPIHPIAGRCKHCKTDLSGLRGARPAAMAALPALQATVMRIAAAPTAPDPYAHQAQRAPTHGHVPAAAMGRQPAPAPRPPTNGHAHYVPLPAAAAHVAIPIAVPTDGSQPVLPPRPTGRMQATAAPGTSFWKNWPLIVIVVAGIAIVVAVILIFVSLVWPSSGVKDKGVKGNSLAPPPAPDRMDTNQLQVQPDPPARSGDPWSNPGGTRGQADPRIDIPDDPDPTDPDNVDPGVAPLAGTGAVLMAMMSRVCKRAEACSALDSSLKDYCDMAMKIPSTPPTCAAARRCFEQIDQMSCDLGFDDMLALQAVTYKIQGCVEALSGC